MELILLDEIIMNRVMDTRFELQYKAVANYSQLYCVSLVCDMVAGFMSPTS